MTLDLSQERTGDAGPAAALGAPALGAPAMGAPAMGGLPARPITMRAVARDLGRLIGVLAEPITPVRRSALVGHVGFLVEQARGCGDGPSSSRSVAYSRLRHEARLWSRDPLRRAQLRVCAQAAAAVVDVVRAGAPADSGPVPPPADRPMVRLRTLPAQRPTALAYHYFWLLDDLPAPLAHDLTTEVSRPARWALRNVLSGGYNRRAYLMWIGGGSGPAV